MRGGISRALAGALFSQIAEGTLVVTQDCERHRWGRVRRRRR